MALTLLDIRFIVERDTAELEDAAIVNWCNDANMDFGANINVPDTFPIAATTTGLVYALPADFKELVRFWLQSEFDNGFDREVTVPFRIFNGSVSFPIPFPSVDTLNMDYYKFLKYFTDPTDTIDIDDKFVTIYTSYCMMRYFMSPSAIAAIGDLEANKRYERAGLNYQNAKRQVIANYGFTTPDVVIKERW